MKSHSAEDEDTAVAIATMDRTHLITLLQEIHCSFPLDLTDEFLQAISLEHLRHIALATSLHQVKTSA